MKRRETGKLGEKIAKLYLKRKGYEILTTNFRTRFGEIDIVCKKDGFIVFVEVRTKNKTSLMLPEESIDKKKLTHLKKAGFLYLSSFKKTFKGFRFDFIGITLNKEGEKINHIENIEV